MMKKTDEIVWEDPLQITVTARYPNTSNNGLVDFEKFLSTLICRCFVFWQGEWVGVILSSWKNL